MLCIALNRRAILVERWQRYVFAMHYYRTVTNSACLLLCCSDRLGYPHIAVIRVELTFIDWALYDLALVPAWSLPSSGLLLSLSLLH